MSGRGVFTMTSFLLALLFACLCIVVCSGDQASHNCDGDDEHWCTNQVAVKIDNAVDVDEIASSHGFTNKGQIGSLEGYYLFEKNGGHRVKRTVTEQLSSHPLVDWVEPQIAKKRVKRDFLAEPASSTSERAKRDSRGPTLPWKDPLYNKQWYLHGGAAGGYDMKVLGAWNLGYSGKGVVVTILDDGIQTDHPDLKQNYDPEASKDINNNDDDPTPQDNGENKHGTRCAGEVAAVAGNDVCGVGIAYNAKIGGVRMLDGPVSDAVEGASLALNQNHIDIYSASWGPEDDGRTVDGPGRLAKEAFLRGITEGRHGKGNIFIWASGNGGNFQDSCSCDGYTTSIYTLSVSSATFNNQKPWYLEECPSSLATTYSSANVNQPAIVSTDMPNSCTESHTGTSASAPIAAGIVALALEANSNLTWRDMQHLVVRTSDPTPLLNNEGWSKNGVGRKVSNKFGYGLMNAEAMVKLAKVWKPLPAQRVCSYTYEKHTPTVFLKSQFSMNLTLQVDGCSQGSPILYLEQVQPIISVQFSRRGDLKITLISPSNTQSVLLPPRGNDNSRTGFQKWPFLSVQQWGENPNGEWTLILENVGPDDNYGEFREWSLTLYGTSTPPQPGDPIVSGSQAEFNAANSADVAGGDGDKSKNEVENNFQIDIPRQAKFPSTDAWNTAGWGGFGGGLTVGDDTRSVLHDKCHAECDESGCYTEESASDCVKCRNYMRNQLNRAGVVCLDKCNEGFYKDENTKYCRKCQNGCPTCSGANYCDSCPPGQFLVDIDPEHLHHGQCMHSCPEDFKSINESNQLKCVPVCGPNCIQCKGGTTCERCKDKYFLTQTHQCVNDCKDGYFGDSTNRACLQCQPFCKKCLGEHLCLECKNGYIWKEEAQICAKFIPVRCSNDQCSIGSYCDKTIGWCAQCHPDCKECIGPSFDHCTKCKNHQLVDQRTRQCPSCKLGQYFDADENACHDCDTHCLVCSQRGHCVTCSQGFGPEQGRCLRCCESGQTRHNCASCPLEPVRKSLTKTVVILCFIGVAFFLLVFGILMWRDRNYERDARKYAYSKVPLLYDVGNDTPLVLDGKSGKSFENGVIQSDLSENTDDEDDIVVDAKQLSNGRYANS